MSTWPSSRITTFHLMRTTYGQIRCHAGALPCTRPAQGFRPPGFRHLGVRRPGFRRPGFRPGPWYTGPTARPGTGERPVGAPDHSQGRNPWAVKPQGETLGGRNPAPPAQTPRQMPRDLRRLRKPRGKHRETCGTPANATVNAERLAGTPANATVNAERLAGLPQTPR